MLSLKIALRYLLTFRSFHFITFITFISIIGIIIGITALICVMSIFNGFREFTESQLTSFTPHLRIISAESKTINNYEELITKIKEFDAVKAISPVVQIKGVAINQTNVQSIIVNAIEPNEISEINNLKKVINYGIYDLENKNGLPKIILGMMLADKLRVLPGDTIRIISLKSIEAYLKTYSINTGALYIVSGLFQSLNEEYDRTYGFIDKKFAYPLTKIPSKSTSSIDIKLKNIKETDEIKEKIEKIIANSKENLKVLTWYDLHRDLYNVMRLERLSTFVVLSLIILISAFNILAGLSMTVIEKRKDIAIFKTLGFENKSIRNIFIYQGLLIGIVSCIVGGALGISLCIGQQTFRWFKLDTAKYVIDAIPVSINVLDIIFVIALSLVLSIVATIYPSKRAVKTNIIEALRSE